MDAMIAATQDKRGRDMTERAAPEMTRRLRQLARIAHPASPIVSVYLNTRWVDEHQRGRVRLFLKNELRKARSGGNDAGLASDLDWIEAQGAALVEQQIVPDAQGVALFACHALALRDTVPVRMPFENAFVVGDAAYLAPLAAVAHDAPPAVIAFVDSASARLVAVAPDGATETVELHGDVPGHHRRGGWAQLAATHYQRHIQVHRDQHLAAVARALERLVEEGGARDVVLAGDDRLVAAFRSHLAPGLAGRVAGAMRASRHETAGTLVSRAAALLAGQPASAGDRDALDAVLTDAAKGGRAAAGPEATLDAVHRGAVHCLHLLRAFGEAGRQCAGCGGLLRGATGPCPRCGGATRPVELSEALVERVLAAGGRVELVESHEGLRDVGGVAAELRYPL
jgi:peptide subunit release factor 1 (eRF1)